MLDMNSMSNELKKYLDSYKRLFFRKQLENPKSKFILDKKRESLGLSKNEVEKAESLITKNLKDSIDFIRAIMELNDSVEVSDDDLLEIKEYCLDLGLEEEDVNLCLEFAKTNDFANEKKEVKEVKEVNEIKEVNEVKTLELEKAAIEENVKIDDKINTESKKVLEKVEKTKEKSKKAKNNKNKDDKSDDTQLPSFKKRAKEILKIDKTLIEEEKALEKKVLSESKSEKSYALELIEMEEKKVDDIKETKSEEVLETKEESTKIQSAEILDEKTSDEKEMISLEVEDIKEDEEETESFEKYFEEDSKENNEETVIGDTIEVISMEVLDDEAGKIDLDLDTTAQMPSSKIESKLFSNFDEKIEVEENKNDTKPYTAPVSFIKYDGKEMFSEENSLDSILNLESRDFRIETLKILFYNGCLICVERFKDNIFDIRGRRNFTNDNIKSAFYDAYNELIDYTHAFLTKEGINDSSIEKDKLFESIFGLQCLQTLSKQISKINIMIDNSVSETQILSSIDRSVGIYRTNSDKPHFRTHAVRSIAKDIKSIFEEARLDYNLRDSIEQGIYKLILEAVEFINKCGLANFDIYTEDNGRTINELLEAKDDAKRLLGKYQDDRNISDDEYAKILIDSIVKYPFFEDTYVALSKVEKANIGKYNLLNSAIELLNKCGEKADNILAEMKVVEKQLYIEEISKIPSNADEEIKKEICRENINIYNIVDLDIIFEAEINHFGYVVSDIDIRRVSEDARIATFKYELTKIKEENCDENLRKEKIHEVKEKYSVRNWECFKAEYAVFGKSFEGNVFADLDSQDRVTIVDYCMKSIKNVAPSGKDKRNMLCELQDRNILDKEQFRDIEKDIFGFVIPLNDEENLEFDFMEKVNHIYKDSNEEIKTLDITIKNKKWEMKIPEFYGLIREMQTEYEPVVMAYVEDSKSGKSKEGFVVTNKAIYSSYAKKFLNLSEIQSLRVKNYSKVKKGERIFFDGIFVDVEHRDYKLCSNYMGSQDDFVEMLNKILDAYREINGLEPLERLEENTEDSMLLGIDSENILFGNKKLQEELKINLEENKYYELMSDLLNYDNLSFKEVLLELSKLVSKEIGEKVYFNEITEGSGEKIREACGSYVMSISELEEIYLVIDNSKKLLLKLQTLGMVISSKGIYCKNKNEDEWFIDLKYANNIKTKDDTKIQITNRIVEFPHIKKKQDLYDLRDLIEFVVVLRKIMDNPLEEISEEIDEMKVSPAESFSLELVNSIKSENLRKMLFVHSEGAASEKRYAAAMSSYADLNDVERPVLLLDTTVFGLKTSGMLITDKNIYYKEGMANSLNINLLAISRVYIKNQKFYINGIEFKFASLTLREKTELCEKVLKLVNYLKSTGFKRI